MLQIKIGEQNDERNLKALNIFNFMSFLGEIRNEGYFYSNEWIYSGNGESIWDEHTAKSMGVTKEWLEKQKEQPITAVQISFSHIITGETMYLFITRETLKCGNESVMWIGLYIDSFSDFGRGRTRIEKMPPIFEEILQASEMILETGKFYRMDTFAFLRNTQGSMFAWLCLNGYRQKQEGKIKIKEDHHEERSFAWAGEFVQKGSEKKYLEIAIYRREFEEWDSNYGGENACVWRDVVTDIYVARSKRTLTESGPEIERKIPLKKLEAEEEINAYLDAFRELDCALIDRGNEE